VRARAFLSKQLTGGSSQQHHQYMYRIRAQRCCTFLLVTNARCAIWLAWLHQRHPLWLGTNPISCIDGR
jgi:hypothetical protein